MEKESVLITAPRRIAVRHPTSRVTELEPDMAESDQTARTLRRIRADQTKAVHPSR
jgi:hypothetical protein